MESLKYLSSEQALGDLATFRLSMTDMFHLNEDVNKWIVFGGSYPGKEVVLSMLRIKTDIRAYIHLLTESTQSPPTLTEIDWSGPRQTKIRQTSQPT